ncbi:DUF4833 domain-containing protein [Aquiflexum balticum]|uniref:DUF4833 domain-containing protein n=1 Tax=Aquiflexum balticum TaxID=280473 RepID=UPI001560E64E|nr:DUF4833 domain-containing protein [Aquiflexum balticum]
MLILNLVLWQIPDTIPEANQHLFFIERSKDSNVIYYDLNQDDLGKLDKDNPIQIYWIKNEKGGKKESLTWIQNKYAYGLKFLKKDAEEVVFQFAPYDKKVFVLKKDYSGVFRIFSDTSQEEMYLEKIFIQIDGGTFWFPKISYVSLQGKCPKIGKEKTEIIKPQL